MKQKTESRSLLYIIAEFILGHKYYANILYTRGRLDPEQLSSFIFRSRAEAEAHALSLRSNRSFGFCETISFRSRRRY